MCSKITIINEHPVHILLRTRALKTQSHRENQNKKIVKSLKDDVEKEMFPEKKKIVAAYQAMSEITDLFKTIK